MTNTDFPAPRYFGVIARLDAEPLQLQVSGTTMVLPSVDYFWRAPDEVQRHLPPDFELPLQCVVFPDGVRRFYPKGSVEGFLTNAVTGGLAVLCHQQQLSAAQRHSYRAMRLVFLLSRRMSEFLGHKFDNRMDLFVVRSGRSDPSEVDVLPDNLGLDVYGRGERWSVTGLIQRGAAAASRAGYGRPTTANCIRYGLVEAARLDPLPCDPSQIPTLVRSALFSTPAERSDPEILEMVTERLLVALDRHLTEATERFDKWFRGRHSSLVHQIAKQKRSRGGRLDQSDVRDALLDLGWQAYQHASNCIHAQMRFFHNAFSEPLTDQERLFFDNMHFPQVYLGNLPLVLLLERFQFLSSILWDLWESLPDLGLCPVLNRLLDYYATMAARRREADRRIKSGGPASFEEHIHVSRDGKSSFQRIAAEIREIRHIDCGCPQREWWAELTGRSKKAHVSVVHSCVACGFQVQTLLSHEEFKKLA